MLAAQTMLEWTGEERWREAWHESADAHLLARGADGFWTQRLFAERGRGRYSLWTGDLGVALYAAECLEGGSVYPFFDLRD